MVPRSELVGERIVGLAQAVGRENVIAATDVVLGKGGLYRRVHPSIMWAKFEAWAEGARPALGNFGPIAGPALCRNGAGATAYDGDFSGSRCAVDHACSESPW